MNAEKRAEAYNQGVLNALVAHKLIKEGEISLPDLKKQTGGPAAGITPSMLKTKLTPSLAAPNKPTSASRIAAPTGGAQRFNAPVPKLPTVADR